METHIAYNRNQWQFNTLNNEKKKKRCHCITADQSEINYSVNSSQLYGNNVNNITRFPLYSGVNLDDSPPQVSTTHSFVRSMSWRRVTP